MEQDTLNNLPEEQKNLIKRVFNLALFRILKNVYLKQSALEQKKMEEIMSSSDAKKIEKFLKPRVKNFENLFKTEVEKISEEIKIEINNRNE